VSLLYTLLDRQQEWLYVIDPATYELQFVNAAARKLSPHIVAGMVCHEALHRRDVPCEGCPARDLPRGQKAESCILNHNLHIHGCVQAEKLDWKGQELCLMTVKEAQ
jgi:putative two-component system response regulator